MLKFPQSLSNGIRTCHKMTLFWEIRQSNQLSVIITYSVIIINVNADTRVQVYSQPKVLKEFVLTFLMRYLFFSSLSFSAWSILWAESKNKYREKKNYWKKKHVSTEKITKVLENLLCKMFLCSNSSCVGRRLSRLKIEQCNESHLSLR